MELVEQANWLHAISQPPFSEYSKVVGTRPLPKLQKQCAECLCGM